MRHVHVDTAKGTGEGPTIRPMVETDNNSRRPEPRLTYILLTESSKTPLKPVQAGCQVCERVVKTLPTFQVE